MVRAFLSFYLLIYYPTPGYPFDPVIGVIYATGIVVKPAITLKRGAPAVPDKKILDVLISPV